MIDDLKMFGRYFAGLPRFLNSTLSLEAAHLMVERQLQLRAPSFLEMVRRAIYARPRSPYLRLLRHAGIEYGWVEEHVRQSGVEATLDRLYRAGVYVAFEEFKGRRPVRAARALFPDAPLRLRQPAAGETL